MKKLILLLGIAVGFVLGSRAGRGPYEQIQANIQKMMGRPEVQEAVDQVSNVAKNQADGVAHAVSEKVEKVVPAGNSTR